MLAPYRGVALIGNPGGARGGLSKAALEGWAKEMGGAAQVTEGADGLWAAVTMAPLKGGDDWSHFMHGADGNLVSNDKAFTGPPLSLQWTGAPFVGGNWDVNVVSDGRLFTAQDSTIVPPDPLPANMPHELLARNLYNGAVMWTRPIALDFGEASSLVIATPQHLFLKDDGAVLDLQPETGALIRRLVATTEKQQTCLWMLESDGVLLALTGTVQKYSDDTLVLGGGDRIKYKERNARVINGFREMNDLYYGNNLVAWDVASGKELWRFNEQQIDPCSIALLSGRLYLYAKLSYAACLDLRLGKQALEDASSHQQSRCSRHRLH